MDTISFDKLLLKTAFCCMASDGEIHEKEIGVLKLMCQQSPLFVNFNFEEEINILVKKLNTSGKEFIQYYFDILKNTSLSEQEEMQLIEFAIKTIHADGNDEYSEIKFFKIIRHSLKISDGKIFKDYPEVESWLEDDINSQSSLEKIANQYLDIINFPKFELISSFNTNTFDNIDKEE